jgi:hypothetical protein
MTTKNVFKGIVGSALTLGLCAASYAAVIVDVEGNGFVGKGDVQLAFEWNNAELQANAAGVTFRLVTGEEVVTWQCEKEGAKNENIKTKSTVQNIGGAISYDARKNKQGQITGFILSGFDGDAESSESGPAVGTCPTDGSDKDNSGWQLVPDSIETVTSGENGDGVLEVCHGGVCHDLTITQ